MGCFFRASPPVGAPLLQHLNADVASRCADRGRRATVTLPMWPVTTGFYTGLQGSQDARGSCKSVNALLTMCTDVRERPGYMNSHLFPSGLGRLPRLSQKTSILTTNTAFFRLLPTVVDLHLQSVSLGNDYPVFKGDLRYYLHQMMSLYLNVILLHYMLQLKLKLDNCFPFMPSDQRRRTGVMFCVLL